MSRVSRPASRVTRHDPLRLNFATGSTLRLVGLLAATASLHGCYLLQAAKGQLAITQARHPIASVIANPNTPSSVQRRLQLVSDAREFASRELGLPDNESYRNYVELKRDYVVWNVFATDRFSVEPRRWCFPIAGCVVYRGYFHESAAQRYALKMRVRGADAVVSGTSAYSTLGHFKDPVLSTMLRWSDAQIAATLFHELAHQVLYVPNDSEFNEAFASVVEEEGARRWLEQRNDLSALFAWRQSRARSLQFTKLLLSTREKLRALYMNAAPTIDLYIEKQREFGRMKFAYQELKAKWNGYSGYDAWFNRTLSNADLISAATYESCVPGLQAMLLNLKGDLPAFYQAAKSLSPNNRRALCGAK